MLRLERAHLGLDAEQRGEEVLDVRAERDQELRLVLAIAARPDSRARRRAGRRAPRPPRADARRTARRCAPRPRRCTDRRSARPAGSDERSGGVERHGEPATSPRRAASAQKLQFYRRGVRSRQADEFYACAPGRRGLPSDAIALTYQVNRQATPTVLRLPRWTIAVPTSAGDAMNRLARLACLAVAAACRGRRPFRSRRSRSSIGELNSYKTFPAFLEPYKKGMELARRRDQRGRRRPRATARDRRRATTTATPATPCASPRSSSRARRSRC